MAERKHTDTEYLNLIAANFEAIDVLYTDPRQFSGSIGVWHTDIRLALDDFETALEKAREEAKERSPARL